MKAYLEKLIKVLSDEDREKIKAIPLKTSKLKVFLNYLLQIHSGEEMPKGELMKYLRVDDKMLRKMKSVLLRKCYNALAPNDGLELLAILSRYRLVENFKRELLLQEIKIKAQKQIEIKHKFYEAAITYLLRLPFSTLDIDELNYYSTLNLKYSKDKEKELQVLFYSGKVLVLRMIQVFYTGDKKKTNFSSFLTAIEELENGYNKFNDDALMALILYCKALYTYWFENNYPEAKKLFRKLITDKNYFRLLPEDFSNSIKGFYGTILYHLNEFDSAIEIFEEYVKEKSPFFYNQPHLLNRLCELYMIKGRINEAKELLDKHLNRFLESGEEDAIQITSIAYTKFYLLTNDLQKSFEYLQIARQHLNKKFYLVYDVEIRTLELIYFILSGDLKFSKAILSRTLKFLREKVKTKELKHQIEKQEILNKMCKAKSRNKPVNTFIEIIEKSFKGLDTINFLLLKNYCQSN